MQPIARELGFSETVFVLPAREGGDVRVRIFTPTDELPFADADAVAGLEPDQRELARLAVCPSCFAADGARVKTRMFAPALGVPEDPATGSAAGPIAVHLARHGVVDFGTEIEIHQGAEIGRPSVL